VLVSFVAIDGLSVIEIDVKLPRFDAIAFQLYIYALYIAFPTVPNGKAKPHDSFLAAAVTVEIATI
jgi:hypothetical protein